MRTPLTADERERRFIQYVLSLNQGQIAELKLRRLGEIANFRRALADLIEQMIEKRAEDLAAGMLMQYAPPRPPKLKAPRVASSTGKRSTPPWIHEQSKALLGRRVSR